MNKTLTSLGASHITP